MTLFTSAPKSICILRLSAIGDVCNTIAAVQAIQHHWPTTEITWITGKLEAQLLQAIPNVTVIVFDKKSGWQGYKALWQQLKNKHFDALLHMQYALRASIATLCIKATYKLGFDTTRSQDGQRLFTNIKVPSPHYPHVLDGLMAFTTCLGVPKAPPHWQLFYSKTNMQWAQQYLSTNKPNLVLVPGASKAYKNWTVTGYKDVIKHAENQGWNIILAGSPAAIEVQLGDEITHHLTHPVTNIIGKSSLLELLALLDLADLVIAPDTGPTHMANAMATPVIGLYAHHNPARTGPYNYLEYVVSIYQQAVEKETGKAIADLDWRTRVKDNHAMQQLSTRNVINMFDKIVADLHLGTIK